MKALFVLLSAAFLSSCAHTAIAPVANPEGVPVVIRVPGVRAGQQATEKQIAAIDAKVEKEIMGDAAVEKADPQIIAAGPIGVYGDVTTKRGEKFVAYLPMIIIRSTYPPEAVDRVAGQLAAAYYRGAKKHFQVIPHTDLIMQPKTKKP